MSSSKKDRAKGKPHGGNIVPKKKPGHAADSPVSNSPQQTAPAGGNRQQRVAHTRNPRGR
jgi:hypothetical protein